MTILKFYSDNCTPCKTLSSLLDGENFPIQAVNIKTEPEATIKYNVRKVPTLVFVNEEKEEVHRLMGVTSSEKVKEILDELQGNKTTQ